MLTSSYYGFYDYWNLYHKVTFDGDNKLIIISDGVTELDVQIELYSDWKEWVRLETNSKYERAFDTVGGEPTVAGQFLDVTYFLVNGWKIKPYSGSYNLNIIGNLFDSAGGDIKIKADVNPLFPNNITVNTSTSVIVRQVSSGSLTGSTEQQLTDISEQLDDQTSQLVVIDNRLISIQAILSQPVQAELVPSQEAILLDLQQKINELHRIHGLSTGTPLVVNKTSRTAGSINQSITQSGDEVTVTRV